MTKKEAFIKIVQKELFDEDCYIESYSSTEEKQKEWNLACEFFNELKEGKTKNSDVMTENGRKSFIWMQENLESMNNVFTSKEIAEGLFTSGRSVSGSMRKLVNDGYVEKIGTNPVQYALTEKGMNYKFDN